MQDAQAIRKRKKHSVRTEKRRVLLVEPDCANKYPPLGLMKIATAYRLNGSEVVFVRGTDKVLRDQHLDEIFITSLFTFRWKPLIETIRFYTAGPTPPRRWSSRVIAAGRHQEGNRRFPSGWPSNQLRPLAAAKLPKLIETWVALRQK